jgi:hypothetical protein
MKKTHLELNYLGRFHVISAEPEVITLDGESVVASMSTELTTIFIASKLLTGKMQDIYPAYPKLSASNGANVAVRYFGVLPEIGFTARIAIFHDYGRATFPALLLDDGRIICWCMLEGRLETMVRCLTDRPERAKQMKALVERHSHTLQ